jgi:hypothetical protein
VEPVVPVNAIVTSATAAGIDAAKAMLRSPLDWPSPVTGFAHRVFSQTGTTKPDFMAQPLKATTAALLRRTPELAAFGYVIDIAEEATSALWIDAVKHLRGRDIYPADRQSFIFNPVEILGVAVGLAGPSLETDDHREWFANTIIRGLNEGQFRTPLSTMAARTALACTDSKARTVKQNTLDLNSLATPELILAAGINLGFGQGSIIDRDIIEGVLVSRLLVDRFPINDAAEAATILISFQRIIDRIALGSRETTPTERVLSLCRRFPLFVERLQKRQRNRPSFSVSDEYDVQDLLHAILRLHFDDVRPEEYTPSHGGNTSKVDFYLPRERIVIEAKMTRANLGQREVTDQLIIDAARYAQIDGVETLICVVYDPERRCGNPKTVENDVENSGSRLKVRAVICPQGL